jgi:hypothetical protein
MSNSGSAVSDRCVGPAPEALDLKLELSREQQVVAVEKLKVLTASESAASLSRSTGAAVILTERLHNSWIR